MIFITIGTQEPFDRLIKAMDEFASLYPDKEFIAQVSETNYKAQHLKTYEFLDPTAFNTLFNQAELVISHAGMGTILSSLTNKKPIIVVPRLVKFGEHRNEHQMATAKKMDELGFVRVAYDMEQLKEDLKKIIEEGNPQPLKNIGLYASKELLGALSKHADGNN